MGIDVILQLVSEHGPWVILVFYLLYRDAQKDQATREVLNKNTAVLIEMATMLKDRVAQGYVR